MSQGESEIPSHLWACRTRLEAGYGLEFDREFGEKKWQAAFAGAESEVRDVRVGADRAVHPSRGCREVEGRPHAGGHHLPYRQARRICGYFRTPGPATPDERGGGIASGSTCRTAGGSG